MSNREADLTHAYAEGRKDEREEWLPVLEALKELIAARNEPFPPFEAGQPAQEAWVMRGVNAEAAARAAIQKAEGAA